MYCLSIRTSIHFLIMLILGLNLALDWLITCKRKTPFMLFLFTTVINAIEIFAKGFKANSMHFSFKHSII